MRIILFILTFFINLWGQWSLWSNPSLPVGNSDKGVGLWAGQIMVGIDNNYQHIDWEHSEIDGENADYEDGDGKKLGNNLEFRTTLEISYELKNKNRIGLSIGHISNANIGDKNPGAEIISLSYQIPY